MKIEIVIPEVTLNTVVADIVSFADDGDEVCEGQATVADKVARLIADAVMRSPEYTRLKNRVTEIRTEEIREQIRPIIAEALQSPIRKTNTWGDPVGEETTLKALIMTTAKQEWSAKDRYSSPWIQETIRTEIRKHIGAEVQKAAKETRDAALKALGDMAAAPVLDAVKKALK